MYEENFYKIPLNEYIDYGKLNSQFLSKNPNFVNHTNQINKQQNNTLIQGSRNLLKAQKLNSTKIPIAGRQFVFDPVNDLENTNKNYRRTAVTPREYRKVLQQDKKVFPHELNYEYNIRKPFFKQYGIENKLSAIPNQSDFQTKKQLKRNIMKQMTSDPDYQSKLKYLQKNIQSNERNRADTIEYTDPGSNLIGVNKYYKENPNINIKYATDHELSHIANAQMANKLGVGKEYAASYNKYPYETSPEEHMANRAAIKGGNDKISDESRKRLILGTIGKLPNANISAIDPKKAEKARNDLLDKIGNTNYIERDLESKIKGKRFDILERNRQNRKINFQFNNWLQDYKTKNNIQDNQPINKNKLYMQFRKDYLKTHPKNSF